jgi:SAM-dependent methyltransferase
MVLDRSYWDSVGRSLEKHHLERNVAEYKRREHIKLLEKWCGSVLGSSTVLKTDLYEDAFGRDSFIHWLADSSKNVVGIDLSKEIIVNALERNPSPTMVNSSVMETPFKDSTFNLVVSNSTLDHIPKENLLPALKELSRILAASGMLVLTLDNAHNPLYRLGYHVVKKTSLQGYIQEKCYRKSEVIPLLEEAGFNVEETGSIVHLPTPFNLIARILSPINRLLFNLPVTAGIAFFNLFGLNGRNIHTGWFLAFKCVKNDV